MIELKKINNYTYELKINNYESNIIYSSILLFMKHGYYNNNKSSIFINCESIKLFSTYLNENDNLLTYEQCLQIINSLSIQINYLFENNYGFYSIDLNDLIVIDNNVFLIINCDKLLKFDIHTNDKMLLVYKYINVNDICFNNPEILNINELPCKISHKCIYYSLGLLIIHCLFGTKLQELNYEPNENILNLIEPIKNTKMYYFLKRCLQNDVNNRYLLFL